MLLVLTPLRGGALVSNHLGLAWKLLPAAGIVFVTGLLDDVIGLRPWHKIAGQLAAASLACWAGLRIAGVSGVSTVSWIGVPLTVLWLVAASNAFNLIDGVDGLAAGVGLFASVTMVLAAVLLQNNVPLALATIPLAGSLLGFLRYNFNPASIFLGDSGSLLIGFLLGCYGVMWTQKSATLLAMTAPLMTLAVPLLDAGLSVLRRFLRGQPIFRADRGHIHHRLLDRGFTPRTVALILYGFCGLAAAFSLVQSAAHSRTAGVAIVLFCGVTWVGIQYLGYAEFDLASRMLVRGGFRNSLNAQLAIRNLEQRLVSAATLDQCWDAVREACVTFDFAEVRLSAAGTIYFERGKTFPPERCWTLRLPLSAVDYISISRPSAAPAPTAVGPLIDVLSVVLAPRIVELTQTSTGLLAVAAVGR
jgi:UDP-GlcNAc:undecaprenyl-phosphate GlcNAc-1-phosphate transferase